jgi:hypothetical protein
MGLACDKNCGYEQSLPCYQKNLELYERLGSTRIEVFRRFDWLRAPTVEQIQGSIAWNPSRLLSMKVGLEPSTCSLVLARFRDDVQATFYILREQPYLVDLRFEI